MYTGHRHKGKKERGKKKKNSTDTAITINHETRNEEGKKKGAFGGISFSLFFLFSYSI
jgi:hypothetical protein